MDNISTFSKSISDINKTINQITKTQQEIADARIEAEQLAAREYKEWLDENFVIAKTMTSNNPFGAVNVYISIEQQCIIIEKKVISFDDIIKVEFEKTERQITTTDVKKSGSVGNAIIGGIIAGGAGAIVGATATGSEGISNTEIITNLDAVTLYLADIENPLFTIYGDSVFNKELYATVLAIITIRDRRRLLS